MKKTGKYVKKADDSDKLNASDTKNSENESAMKTSTPIYRYKDVKFEHAEVSDLNKEGSQPLAYINYADPDRKANTKILVQSGKIKITSHGIPQLDKEGSNNNYYPDDSKREFIKIPLDPEQPPCVELRKHIEAAEEWAGSEEMRIKLFGKKKADKYQFLPCIKTPQKSEDNDDDDDDDEENDDNQDNEKSKKQKKGKKGDDNKKKRPVIDYVKMKFNMIGDNKTGRINKTKLTKVEGKQKTRVIANTVTEIANEVTFRSEIKFIFYYNKIWVNKTAAQGSTKIMYGLGFKIMAIEYTPGSGSSLNTETIEFLSDDDDENQDNEENMKSKNNMNNTSNKNKSSPKTQSSSKMNDHPFDDGDDDDNDGDKTTNNDMSEESQKKSGSKNKPKLKSNKNEDPDDDDMEVSPSKMKLKSKKNTDDVNMNQDDNNASEETSSKKLKSKTKSKQNEDDNDEEITIKKKPKDKDTIKSTKKSQKMDDDDEPSIEEEIKPKKNKSKAASKSK